MAACVATSAAKAEEGATAAFDATARTTDRRGLPYITVLLPGRRRGN